MARCQSKVLNSYKTQLVPKRPYLGVFMGWFSGFNLPNESIPVIKAENNNNTP